MEVRLGLQSFNSPGLWLSPQEIYRLDLIFGYSPTQRLSCEHTQEIHQASTINSSNANYNGVAVPEPELMLKTRLHQGNHQVFIKWKHQLAAEASWEDAELFKQIYPTFQLEDEQILQVGRNIMVGKTYSRTRPPSG